LLIDGDPNRSATGWAKRGQLPFRVIDECQAARFARDYQHVVIDTEARPEEEDLKSLADGCDLLVIPSCPDALSLDALMQTTAAMEKIGGRFRVLLTIIPPYSTQTFQGRGRGPSDAYGLRVTAVCRQHPAPGGISESSFSRSAHQ
jgi:chromosome partitioning protein